jgi:hypothetical protein
MGLIAAYATVTLGCVCAGASLGNENRRSDRTAQLTTRANLQEIERFTDQNLPAPFLKVFQRGLNKSGRFPNP